MRPIRVCVVAYGVRLDRKTATCKGLAEHLHATRAKIQKLVEAGMLRRIRGSIYQRTRQGTERVQWAKHQSGKYGPSVFQIETPDLLKRYKR